jgi:hypothetical protein
MGAGEAGAMTGQAERTPTEVGRPRHWSVAEHNGHAAPAWLQQVIDRAAWQSEMGLEQRREGLRPR